jgi:hypothetical protein
MLKKLFAISAALVFAGSVASAGTAKLPGLRIQAVPMPKSGSLHPTVPANLYPISAQFGYLPPKDGSGNDYWPCYTGGSNADCSSIPANGVVVGIPLYTPWSVSACNTSTPCGQIYFFYDDLTNDSTDDLIVTVTVKQGTNYILAVGPKDIGPNPFANEVVVFSGDKAFGTQGQAGKGNGWCAGTRHTCVDPVAGVANGEAVIQVGPYHMKEKFNFYLQ